MNRYATAIKLIVFVALFFIFTAKSFSQKNDEPVVTEKGFHYESLNILLPRLADKGFSGDEIRNNLRVKDFQFPRPKPLAAFAASRLTGKESMPFEPIPVELLEEAGVARNAAVRFGLPFPEKSLFSTGVLEIRDPSGKVIPSQFAVTEFWPDHSIRWCLVHFVAPLSAGEKAVYSVHYVQDTPKPGTSVSVKEDDEKIVVDTGKIMVEIDKIRFNILRHVSLAGQPVGAAVDGGVIGHTEDGRAFSLSSIKPRRIAFEEKGSETVVVRLDGSYGYSDGSPSFLDYTVRLRFVRDSARVQIDITTTNVGLENEFSDFKDMQLTFKPEGRILNATGNVYDAKLAAYENKAGAVSKTLKSAIPATLTQWTDRDYAHNSSTMQPGRLASGLLLETSQGKLALAVRDLWKRWPKGFDVDQDRVSVAILPPLPSREFDLDLPHQLAFPFREGYYRLKWGMSFTESLFLDFMPDSVGVQAEADFPIVAVVDRDWYVQSGVVPGVTLKSDHRFDGWDAKITSAFYDHMQLKERQREYGFLNYGDWYGERRTNWGNNEYDTARSLFAAFARTGNRDMQRLAIATARHQADADVVHAYPDPYYIGGEVLHSTGHTGFYGDETRPGTWSYRAGWQVEASNGHTWVGGLLDAWRFAGEARVRDAALEQGEHMTWGMSMIFKALGTHERSAGWSLTAICQLAESTNDPEYFKAADRIIAVPLREQKFEHGGAWPHLLPGDHAGGYENTFGNAVFLVGTVVEGMRRYHKITGDPAVKKSLEAACEWLKVTRNPEKGQWPYTASWEGKPYSDSNTWAVYLAPAMIYTARICDRDDIAESAVAGMMASYQQERISGFGKSFAQSCLFLGDMMEEMKKWDEEGRKNDNLYDFSGQ